MAILEAIRLHDLCSIALPRWQSFANVLLVTLRATFCIAQSGQSWSVRSAQGMAFEQRPRCCVPLIHLPRSVTPVTQVLPKIQRSKMTAWTSRTYSLYASAQCIAPRVRALPKPACSLCSSMARHTLRRVSLYIPRSPPLVQVDNLWVLARGARKIILKGSQRREYDVPRRQLGQRFFSIHICAFAALRKAWRR